MTPLIMRQGLKMETINIFIIAAVARSVCIYNYVHFVFFINLESGIYNVSNACHVIAYLQCQSCYRIAIWPGEKREIQRELCV